MPEVGLEPTHPLRIRDFESRASANSATPAGVGNRPALLRVRRRLGRVASVGTCSMCRMSFNERQSSVDGGNGAQRTDEGDVLGRNLLIRTSGPQRFQHQTLLQQRCDLLCHVVPAACIATDSGRASRKAKTRMA